MTTLTLYRFGQLPNRQEVINAIDGKKDNNFWFKAKENKYGGNEIDIDVWFEEDIELGLKRAFGDDGQDAAHILKQQGKEKIVRRVYCFIDLELKTLEIYRGPDAVTSKIKEKLEEFLQTTFSGAVLTSDQLKKIVSSHSSELKQAIFKYIHGLWYHIIRGRHLEVNGKYNQYLQTKPDSLRVVSVVPKIRYMNGRDYQVTINGDKGTINIWDGFFKWKPRFEIKQIVNLIVATTDFSF